MRLTVLQQTAKGLPEQTRDEETDYPVRTPVLRELERLKWYLWHGNVYKALQVVQSVEMDLDAAVATSGHATARKLLKAVEEFQTYIANNQSFIPNYGERYRYGERISTGFVESTVNQVISKRFCKKQQMGWTPRGAHLPPADPDARVKWGLGSDLPGVGIRGSVRLPNRWRRDPPEANTLLVLGDMDVTFSRLEIIHLLRRQYHLFSARHVTFPARGCRFSAGAAGPLSAGVRWT